MDYIYQDKYVYFKKEGNGSPIILLHGWGVDSSCFDDLMDSLKEKYQVFAIDLPGVW
ncbi:MAG: alpha/beta fold hydrolase [Christensenellales bacterium]